MRHLGIAHSIAVILFSTKQGVILVNIVRARGLPGSEMPTGSVHPYLKLKVSGQQQVVQTSHRGRAQVRGADSIPTPPRPRLRSGSTPHRRAVRVSYLD